MVTRWETWIRQSNAELRPLAEARPRVLAPRKAGSCSPSRPYRKPTQVGECKRTQARERNLSKELGTLAP